MARGLLGKSSLLQIKQKLARRTALKECDLVIVVCIYFILFLNLFYILYFIYYLFILFYFFFSYNFYFYFIFYNYYFY